MRTPQGGSCIRGGRLEIGRAVDEVFWLLRRRPGRRGSPAIPSRRPGGPDESAWRARPSPGLRPDIGAARARTSKWHGVPQRPDGGDGFFEPCHRLGPIHTKRFVVFPFAGADTQDCASPGKQMQSCGRLRGDRGIAPTGIGRPDTKMQPPEAVSGGQMPEHRPRFKNGVDLGNACSAHVLGVAIRTRRQRDEMVSQPKRIRPGG